MWHIIQLVSIISISITCTCIGVIILYVIIMLLSQGKEFIRTVYTKPNTYTPNAITHGTQTTVHVADTRRLLEYSKHMDMLCSEVGIERSVTSEWEQRTVGNCIVGIHNK